MKYFTFPIALVAIATLTACIQPDGPDSDVPPPAAMFDADAVQDLVHMYMKFTLGSIPGADIDYDAARELMTPDFAAAFTDPMFIPSTYCIQDGPEDVRITDVTFNEQMNWAEAKVVGAYHGGWQDMWKFTVVPVEGDGWMIHKIDCLTLE